MGKQLFSEADLIHVYTRAQAIEDGQLVDVSETARQAGITFPVALTAAVYGLCVEVPPRRTGIEDVAGRLWDVLWMLRLAARRSGGQRIDFTVQCSTRAGRRNVRLKALCGPGDDARPVVTVMLPGED
jgi:hypothetical protein